MSTTECTSYQAHAWKKDICANCKKARSSHSANSTIQNKPVASKRITVQTPKSVVSSGSKTTSTAKQDHGYGVGSSSKPKSSVSSNGTVQKTTATAAARSKMKRDNSSESSLSSKCSGSSTSRGYSSSKTSTSTAGYRSKMKRDESSESNLSAKSSGSDKSTKGGYKKDTKVRVGSSTAASKNNTTSTKLKRDDSKDSILSDKSSENGDRNVENALKTLTSKSVASPKSSRKQGSRTTMNYGTSLNNNNISSPTHAAAVDNNTTGKPNGGWLHTAGSKSSAGSSSRVTIPLDKNAGKLSAMVNPEKVVPQNKNGPPSKNVDPNPTMITTKTEETKTTPSSGANNTNKNMAKVENRKVLIDKGKYSTEKIIFDKTIVVTTSKENINSNSTKTGSKHESIWKKSTSKEELPSVVNNKNDKMSSDGKSQQQTVSNCSKASSVGSQRSSVNRSISSGSSKTSEAAIGKRSDNNRTQSVSAKNGDHQCVSSLDKSAPQKKRDSSDLDTLDDRPSGAKVVRKRSKSQRPQAAPPCVPPDGSTKPSPPSKAMMESYHSDVSMSESQSSESQLSQIGASPVKNKNQGGGTKAVGDDNSFSDLYDDIMNSLSEVKDFTPDLLKKLKDDGPAKEEQGQGKHYYHKYDYGGKKSKELSLSSAVCEGSSSIIVETMNTSFHAGGGDGDVEEMTSQTLAMPYNIVDVSTFLPSNKRDKSPSLPKTPAPESRSATLNRSTLAKKNVGSPKPKERNMSTLKKQSNSTEEKDLKVVSGEVASKDSLQGLPPKYWHTYEPIDLCQEAKKNKDNNKEGITTADTQKSCDKKTAVVCGTTNNGDVNAKESFVRQSKVRATAPVRGQKVGSNSALDTQSLDHLDLQRKPEEKMSKSAEDLLFDNTKDSLGDPKSNNLSSGKDTKKKNGNGSGGGGFFRRLFGLSRKDNLSPEHEITEEGTSVDREPTSASSDASLQENAEFFKPLQIDTNVSKESLQSSPRKEIGSPNLVAEIENAMSEVKLNTKDFKLNIPDSKASQSCDSASNQNHVNKNLNDASPIEPYGTCKDFIFTKNEKTDSKSVKVTKPKAVLNRPKESPPPPINPSAAASSLANKPTISPKPRNTGQTSSPAHRASKAKSAFLSQSPDHKLTVNIAMTTSVDGSISPTVANNNSQVSGSTSQCSLLSDGSSDGRSISSKEDPGSSGDSRDLARELKHRKPRPKSQAVSRKMLNAPPPPPPPAPQSPGSGSQGDGRRKTSEGGSTSSPDVPPTSPKIYGTAPKATTSPTSPTKLLTNPFSKSSLKGKSKRLSMTEDVDEAKRPMSPKKIEISGPIELQSSTLNSSQTLPRPVKKSVDIFVKESQDDLVTGTTGRRRMDSVAKHARNKTVTEGVKVDIQSLTNGSSGSNSGSENDGRLAELLDQKTVNKFVNRALPPTPSELNGSDPHPGMVKIYRNPELNGTDQDTDYEWVSVEGFQLRGKSSKPPGGNYGDAGDDIYTDPIENVGSNRLSPTKGRKSALKHQLSSPARLVIAGGPTLKAPPASFAEYLRPNDTGKPAISPKPVINGDAKVSAEKDELGLGPKSYTNHSGENKENYVSMTYVNTEMIIDRSSSPLDVGEGFKRMAFINVETLLHIANTTVSEYIHQDAKLAEDLKFSHFVLKSTKPYIHQGFVAYYNARTYKLKPNECLLMISGQYINPDLLHHTCVHLLQPSLIFSDRILATYFPDNHNSTKSPASSMTTTLNPSSKLYQLGGMVQTNMAVVTYHSIQTLDKYLTETADIGRKKASAVASDHGGASEAYQKCVAYFLFQIMSAVLSQQDGTSVYVVKTVRLSDVLVVSYPATPEEYYLVVNPLSSSEVDIKEDELLCTDLIRLLCYFLDIPYSDSHRNIMSKIVGRSKYAASLKKFVDVLGGNSLTSLLVGRSILEYTLWGPTEKEIKSLLLSEDREQAFCIWLEVARCKGANELALGQLKKNLELSHMFHFLCSVTGSTLLDISKLLFKHK